MKNKSLALGLPILTKKLHPTLNGDITPKDVTTGSGKRVWWRHYDYKYSQWH